jgi:two-component system, NarL family, nitrate/nitrite response regulator NarL
LPLKIFIADRNLMSSQLLAESLGRDTDLQVISVAPAAKILSVPTTEGSAIAVISAELDSTPRKGLQLARSLLARNHDFSIIILLDYLEREAVVASFRSGASAVFCRTLPVAEFRHCISSVSRGRLWAGRKETEYLLQAIRSAPSCDGIGELSKLTKREVAVAELAAQGLSNKQIANELALSEHTIKNYLFRVFEKLNVANRIELLFLMLKGQSNDLTVRPFFEEPLQESAVVAAAEDGFLAAQLVLGIAHLSGNVAQTNNRAAYHWIRMLELNCAAFLEQSRSAINELRSRLKPEEVMELEKGVSHKMQLQELKSKRQTEPMHPRIRAIARLAG